MEESKTDVSATTSEEQAVRDTTEQPWEVKVTKSVILFLFVAITASFILAIFVSLYRGATTAPDVWASSTKTSKNNRAGKVAPFKLRKCVGVLQTLDREQHQQTRRLWFRMRNGHRGHLTLWQEWSRDWRRRMKRLLKQCPLQHTPGSKGASNQSLRSMPQCAKKMAALTKTLKKKATALWDNERKGRQGDLQKWQDWSRNWNRRMGMLIKRCPLYDKGEIAKAFHRASHKMMQLQREQERVVLPFFKKSSDLFRDIRQAMHSLKEELR
jgi:ketosteroid isomerase-like protein